MGKRTRHGIRVALFAGATLSGLLGTASIGSAQTTTTPAQPAVVDCGTTSYRFLFWPKGHGAVPSQSFPAFALPHTELYSGTGTTYPDGQFIGYADAAGQTGHAKTCTAAAVSGSAGGPIPKANMKRTTKTTALACTVTGADVLTVPNAQGASSVGVIISGQTVATASMQGKGSSLTYDKTKCKLQKPPR